MENVTATTLSAIGEHLVRLGMLTEQQVREAQAKVREWWSPDRELDDPEEVIDALTEYGLAVQVDRFDVDNQEDSYREILERAAASTGGAVTVAEIELTGELEEDPEELRFLLNGRPVAWKLDHPREDYLDVLTMFERFQDLNPGDSRTFHYIPGHERDANDVHVLATPEQAEALRTEYGITLHSPYD